MSLSRRSLLQQLSLGAGATLLSPFLSRLAAGNAGPVAAPKRVVFILQANGFQPWAAQPKGLTRTEEGPTSVVDVPLTMYELPDDMAPLQPYAARTTIIQRLSGKHTYPHHSAWFGALSGVAGRRGKPEAETIDAAFAQMNPATFPLVNLGVATYEKTKTEDGKFNCCSAWAKDKPIATQSEPILAYQALFGKAAKEKGVYAAIDDDARKLRDALSAREREEFSKYLDAFRSLEQKKELFAKAPAAYIPLEDRPAGVVASTLETKRLEAQFEIAAAALMTGLTNTVTINSGLCNTNGYFEGLDFDKLELHGLGHEDDDGKRTWQQIYTHLRQYHFKLIVELIEKLNSASDHDGSSMMDNTLIVYTSDGAHDHHSNGDEWPFVLIGNLGGKLRTGRFIEYPAVEQKGNRTINALYGTLLQAAGSPRDGFNLHEYKGSPVDTAEPMKELLN